MSGQFEGTVAQFEILPFGAGGGQHEAQLEEERWGRRGGGRGRVGTARGGRPPPMVSKRPAAKPPRPRYPRSAPWPAYPVPAWPWARWDLAPAEPYAQEPYPEPAEEPFDEEAKGAVSPAKRAELERWVKGLAPAERAALRRLPGGLRRVLADLAPSRRPRYVSLGMLKDAVNNRNADKPGLYLIVFRQGGRRHAYHGESGNVRERLVAHLRSATRLGIPVDNHEAFIWVRPHNAQRRPVEAWINEQMRKRYPGVFTNEQREFAAEVLGEAWI